jgi:hypothetical protein
MLLGCNQHRAEKDVPQAAPNTEKPMTMQEANSWPAPLEFDGLYARLWEYTVPYQSDMNKVLAELRESEFKAGRFYRSELRPKTIEDAIRNADAPGTRSILDIQRVSLKPELLTISRAPAEQVRALFGTDKPSHSMVETASKKKSHDFFTFLETYDRGQALYIVLYEGDRPVEIYIAGWSCH